MLFTKEKIFRHLAMKLMNYNNNCLEIKIWMKLIGNHKIRIYKLQKILKIYKQRNVLKIKLTLVVIQ